MGAAAPSQIRVVHHLHAPFASVEAFYRSPAALPRLTPPLVRVDVALFQPLAPGSVCAFHVRPFLGVGALRWVARHDNIRREWEPRCRLVFNDEMVEGPLAAWRHTHIIEEVSSTRTRVEDRVQYHHTGGAAGLATRLVFNGLTLRLLFCWRAVVSSVLVR